MKQKRATTWQDIEDIILYLVNSGKFMSAESIGKKFGISKQAISSRLNSLLRLGRFIIIRQVDKPNKVFWGVRRR